MKNVFTAALLLMFCIITLTGCNRDINKETETSFRAQVLEVYEDSLLVSPLDGEDILRSSDKIAFSTKDLSDLGAEVGDTVIVVYTGDIMESYPAQINAIGLNLLSEIQISNVPNVEMTVNESTVTATGLKLTIVDNNEIAFVYGEWYSIERYEHNTWLEQPVVIEGDYGFDDIGYMVTDGKVEFDIDWEWLYGSLTAGKYRILKSIYDNGTNLYITADFEIK